MDKRGLEATTLKTISLVFPNHHRPEGEILKLHDIELNFFLPSNTNSPDAMVA